MIEVFCCASNSGRVSLRQSCQDDFDVYARASGSSEDLKVSRVIARAKSGDLVSGESASCEELNEIVQARAGRITLPAATALLTTVY